MPSSEQHISEAERHLGILKNRYTGMPTYPEWDAAMAQIHATLAVARAIREANGLS